MRVVLVLFLAVATARDIDYVLDDDNGLILAAATAHAIDYVLDNEDGLVLDVRCTRRQAACRGDLKLFCNQVTRTCNCVPNFAFNHTAGTCQPCLVMTESTCPMCCPQKGWHCSNGQCIEGRFDYTNNMLNLIFVCGVVALMYKLYFVCNRWDKKIALRAEEVDQRNAADTYLRRMFLDRSDPLTTGSVALLTPVTPVTPVTAVVEAPTATDDNDRLPTYIEVLEINEYENRPKAEASHVTSMV